MNQSRSQDKVLSFLLLSLDGDGGIRSMLALAQGFIERGFKVDIIVLPAGAEAEGKQWLPPKARIVELQSGHRGFSKLQYFLALTQYLRRVQPLALIEQDLISVAVFAKKLAGVQTRIFVNIQTNLSNFLIYSPPEVQRSLTAFLMRRYLGFYGWADAIVPVSQGVGDDLEQIAGKTLKNIQVIYNPVVTPKLFERAKEPIEHEWFTTGAPPVILGVGRLNVQKDFSTLIRAFAIVRKNTAAKLMILGEGEERSQLETLVEQMGLTADVALPGFVDNPYAFMAASAVFVLSSVYEGLPTVLIEAMAVGTPVVSTDCPSGPREILASGKYGKLVPVGDAGALADAITTTLSQTTDVRALQQRAQKFSLDNIVNSYLALIGSDDIRIAKTR